MRTALSTERKGRQEAEQSVRELAKAAEEGSDAKNQLTKVADDLAELNRKADFYEQAHEAGVSNIKLAYLVAKQDDLFDRKGNLEVDALREAYPELFRSKKIPPSGAGEGSPTGLAPEDGMNQFIRRSAGRKT